MGTDHDGLVANVRAIMEHVRRSDGCCAHGDPVSRFAHYASFSDTNEERHAQVYALLVEQEVLTIEEVEEVETNLEDRRQNMPGF